MNARNAELRKRAEWAEGILQRQVQATAAEVTPSQIEEGEAPGDCAGPPLAQLESEKVVAVTTDGAVETVLGRRRVCPVCMDKPRAAAMVPCGHTACITCATQLEMHRGTCAECNAKIELVLPLFGI